MPGWDEAASVTRGGIRRELFLCPGGDAIFASLYASDRGGSGPAMVVGPSWGYEMIETLHFCHALARGLAQRDGAALVLHWPGHGDSGGEPEDADLDALGEAAARGLREARIRVPTLRWGLAGIRLGAAAVALAAGIADASSLLLIRPALDPVEYFQEARRASRRASLGRDDGEDWAFGHPLPRSGAPVDVSGALREFQGPAACIIYESEAVETPLETVRVRGGWDKRDLAPNADLVNASLAWASSVTGPARV